MRNFLLLICLILLVACNGKSVSKQPVDTGVPVSFYGIQGSLDTSFMFVGNGVDSFSVQGIKYTYNKKPKVHHYEGKTAVYVKRSFSPEVTELLALSHLYRSAGRLKFTSPTGGKRKWMGGVQYTVDIVETSGTDPGLKEYFNISRKENYIAADRYYVLRFLRAASAEIRYITYLVDCESVEQSFASRAELESFMLERFDQRYKAK